MSLDSFLLDPVLAAKPWGGSKLATLGKRVPADVRIGESWEVADLPSDRVTTVDHPRSTVVSGPHAGSTLAELIASHGRALMGSARATPDGDFPLLVKLLDAEEFLSVQVHPHDAYVTRHPEAHLKTESWYVVAAEPDAELLLGFLDGVTLDDVRRTAGTPGFVDLLRRVPARVGDFHHVPAGTVHALGPGVLVAEVQTPSDTTFRIYDWNVEYGRAPRDMHIEQALETLIIDHEPEPRVPPPGHTRTLIEDPHYWIVEHRGDGAMLIDTAPELRVLLVLDGAVDIDGLTVPAGATAIVPAAVAPTVRVRATQSAIVLEIGLVMRQVPSSG